MTTDREKDRTAKLDRLLSAYLDGELSQAKLAEIASMLRAGDDALRAEFADLQRIRQEVRGYYRKQYLDQMGQVRDLNIWARIEKDVREIAADRAAAPKAWLHWPTTVSSWLRVVVNRPALAGLTAACAILVYAFAGYNSPQEALNMEGPPLGSVMDNAQVASARLSNTPIPRVTNVSLRPPIMPLSMPDSMTAVYRKRTLPSHGVPAHLRSFSQMVDREFVLGGVRANGVDIDWIKSDQKFNIFLTEDIHTPPIIWVAHRRSAASKASSPSDYEN